MTISKSKSIGHGGEDFLQEKEAARMKSQIEELTRQLDSEKLLRKSLQKSQEHRYQEWQITLDTLKEAIIIMDKDRNVIRANDAAYELLSTGDNDIIGRKCHHLFVDSNSPCTVCPLLIAESSGKRYELEIERLFLGKTLRISCSPVYRDAELIGFVHSAIDISHQRNLEKQLVQAQKMEAIATLAGGIAHDFNNILGAILGNADLLYYRLPADFSEVTGARNPLTVEQVKEHLAAIQKASMRARDLVSQILTFSRQSPTRRRDIHITPVVKEVVKLLRSSLPATIELHADIGSEIGSISADPTQIHQILMNLCTNAVNALEKQRGRIEISLYETRIHPGEDRASLDLHNGEYVVLTVRDNGIGMSDEIMERMYEPFFTTREVGEGTGMGLAVLHGLVTAHNAAIDVSSKPGSGTVFKVYFPKIKIQKDSVENEPATSLPTGSETIIFADDEEDIVKMNTRMLQYLGYNVIAAASGEQVVSYLEEHLQEVDLIITDQTMPQMTGLELAEKIHAMRSDLPVILCSGYSDAPGSKTTQRPGINKFLAKPFKMKELAGAIRQVFSEKN